MRCLSIILLFVSATLCMAMPSDSASVVATKQEGWGSVSRTYLFGIGRSSQLDTYLSPYSYTGPQWSFLTRIDRPTKWAQGRVSYQGTFLGALTQVHNAAGSGTMWGAHVGYDGGWYYNWPLQHGFLLKAGGLIGTDLGFLYNVRGGNNPAQGRLNVRLSLSAGAQYDLRIRRQHLFFNYQADMPLVGVMFSPHFGQSYYEMYLGNRHSNVCCAYPGNAFTVRQLLSVTLPLKHFSLVAGYLCDVRQSGVNGLRMHDISHSFLFGFSKQLWLKR